MGGRVRYPAAASRAGTAPTGSRQRTGAGFTL